MGTKKGIGYSSLSQKVYLGKQNKEKGMWVGEKEDITNDFIQVLLQYVEPNTVRTISTVSGSEINLIINLKQDEESIKRTILYLQNLIK